MLLTIELGSSRNVERARTANGRVADDTGLARVVCLLIRVG